VSIPMTIGSGMQNPRDCSEQPQRTTEEYGLKMVERAMYGERRSTRRWPPRTSSGEVAPVICPYYTIDDCALFRND
jgi:hypothetical protein